MRLRSGRRLMSPPAPRSGGGADRISALADNLLLLVLARLGCVRTAARAGVLSRRWRGLWTRLPALVFRDVAFRSLEPVLAHVTSSASTHAVSLVDMRLRKREWSLRASAPSVSVTSLLRAAARLSPEHLVLALPWGAAAMFEDVELSSLQRATSISLTSWSPINLRAPSGGELLPALTTLVLLGCTTDGLAALVASCPCLRTLRLSRPGSSCVAGIPLDITVRSSSLRELVVEETQAHVDRIDVATPMLEQLTVSALGASRLSVSVLAPMAGNVSWRCRYYQDIWLLDAVDHRLAYWTLDMVSLLSAPKTATERPRPPVLRIDAVKNKYGALEYSWTQAKARQVEQHLQMEVAADLSALDLELNLTTLGHVYGAVVFFFLNMHPIRTAIRRLKLRVGLPDPERAPTDEEECGERCECAPTNWTSRVISLTDLAEVEIDGFQGDHHEFAVLKRLFRCAPMLKKVILKQSDKVTLSDAKVDDFFNAHPFVECY